MLNFIISNNYIVLLCTHQFQIELDLLRTVPNNRHYEHMNSEGVPKLRRVLLAYSQHNPAIGYCQVNNITNKIPFLTYIVLKCILSKLLRDC